MTAQVIVAPMRTASTLPISGKVVIRQRKYMALEMMPADTPSNAICSKLIKNS
jgi:hypothetical protein